MNQNNNLASEEQINFTDLIQQIKESKSLIFWTTLILALSALIYALQKPHLYKTTFLLTPSFIKYPNGIEEQIEPLEETVANLKVKMFYEQLSKQNDEHKLKFFILENQLIKIVNTSESENENLSRINEVIEYLVSRDKLKANSQIEKIKKEFTGKIASLERQVKFTKKIESKQIIDLNNQYKILESKKNSTDLVRVKFDTLRKISAIENSSKVFELIESKKTLESELQDINRTNIILAKIYSETFTETISPRVALITTLGFFGGLFTSLILIFLNKLSSTVRTPKL